MSLKPVHIVWAGSFGKAVAADLEALRTDCWITAASEDAPGLPEARIHVLAAWRPMPDICERLDRSSHESRCPFVPLIADGAALRLGPVIIPGKGCCWGCWTQRIRQHHPWADRREAVLSHYAAHADQGPHGYLRPFAMTGAARLSSVIDEIDLGAAAGGSVWEINMITREIVTGTAVGVHDCPRCGLQRPPATRSFAEMREQLEYLWEDRHVS